MGIIFGGFLDLATFKATLLKGQRNPKVETLSCSPDCRNFDNKYWIIRKLIIKMPA